MKIFEQVSIQLNKLFKDFGIDENVDIKISKLEDVDYQIDNLVKFAKHDQINHIMKEVNNLLSKSKIVESYEITDNCFINLNLNLNGCDKFLSNMKNNLLTDRPKKIIIDYGGPNIGKPLHVGHLRSLNIGRSIKKLNEVIGNDVVTDIHLGDWGMPVAQIITYCELNNIEIKSLTVERLLEIYPESSELYENSETFKKDAQKINKNLNNSNVEVLNKWSLIREISVEDLKSTLSKLSHDFDLWLGESSVNELIKPMIESLKTKGKINLDSGALVSAEETDPKILITKSDGSYLYLTTDLATILNRIENYDFDIALYVVDSRQKLHFEQLFKTAKYFDFPKRKYEHVDFGTINDKEGRPFKTRDGGTKKLLSLYNETFEYIKNINEQLDENIIHDLTNTVLTYSDLLTNRRTDYKFDLEKFTNISGKTGIYVQYAQVRAKNIIKASKSKSRSEKIKIISSAERNLIIGLLNLEIIIKQSLKFNEPHHLANYLYEICNLFNIFYEEENIINLKDEKIKKSKLLLTSYFLEVTNLVFISLGIKAVNKM